MTCQMILSETMGKTTAMSVATIVIVVFALSASAQTGLPDGYGQLSWGANPKQAVKVIDKEVNAPGFLAVAMKNHIKKIIEQYKEEHPDLEPPSAEEFEDQFNVEDFRKDIFYDELSVYGEKPQYYKDLLGSEIELNTGEGVIAVENEPSLYYLFAGNKLWKVVVVHGEDESAKISFKAFVDDLASKYGPPSKVEYEHAAPGPGVSEPGTKQAQEAKKAGTGEARPVRAFWETSTTRLEARIEKNGYREIYVSKAILSNIDAIRKEGKKKFKGL